MIPFTLQSNEVLLRDPVNNGWLLFRRPVKVLCAVRAEEVLTTLQEVDRATRDQGAFAAGFIAYEAAGAFDPALKTRPGAGFPLAWFGLYRQPEFFPASLPLGGQESPYRISPWTPAVTRDEYDAAIQKIKDYIACGDTYQVNYTYRLCSDFAGDPLGFFFELARAQNAPYAAYINAASFAILSASPELFFRLDGSRLTSIPMKGTAPRGRTLLEDREQKEWLNRSLKDQAENVMIVDMVRNDIGKIARTGSVQVPSLFAIEKYPTVWQMVSTVAGDTDAGLGEVFQALFPPASITGAPKARTMEIIRELETTPRRVYTGCIGYAGPGRQAQFNVAIRTVLIDKSTGRAEYGVGGGITWDSSDSAEFAECQAKARILTARFPRFCLLETLRWTPNEGYFLLEQHLRRLADSAEYFSFPVHLDAVRGYLREIAGAFGPGAVKVRLLVDEHGQVSSQAEPVRLPTGQEQLRICLAPTPVDRTDPFLYHKTTHRKVYEQAWQSCCVDGDESWDDVLLWNESGEITETCTANVLVELDGELFTPPVSSGLLPGCYRAWLLEQGIVKEKPIPLAVLRSRPRIYLINSVRGQRAAQLVGSIATWNRLPR